MPNLDKPLAIINVRTAGGQGGGGIIETGGAVAGTPTPTPPPPSGLTVTEAVLARSAVTPTANAYLAWTRPPRTAVGSYAIEAARDASFTQIIRRLEADADKVEAAVDGLPAGETAYFRIATVAAGGLQGRWSAGVSALMPEDTTPPAPATAVAGIWSGYSGAITITWLPSAAPNLKHYRVEIYTADGLTQLHEDVSAAPAYTFTRDQHYAATAGAFVFAVLIRVTAVSWGNVDSAAAEASASLALPANPNPADVITTWDGHAGALQLQYNLAPEIAGVQLMLNGHPHSPGAVPEYLYTLSQNRADNGPAGSPSVAWSLAYVDALGQLSPTPATGVATLPPPATPVGVEHTWEDDDGTADEAITWQWLTADGVAGYTLTIDGKARDLPLEGEFHYPYAKNRQEHGGVASASLAWALAARDAFGQLSTPASGTAINAPPAAVAITINGTVNVLGYELTPPPARDLDTYRVRFYRDGVQFHELDTYELFGALDIAEQGEGLYTADVAARDLFGQLGSVTTSATAELDPISLAEIRAGAVYADSNTNDPELLRQFLSDSVTNTGGISYTGAATYHWTQFQRAYIDRYKPITIVTHAESATLFCYITTSEDGETWRYFAGPISNGRILSEKADEAAAQAAAFVPWNLSSTSADLPTITQARFVRVYHATDAGGIGLPYTIREFYPRRLVQADDVETESLEARHIRANSITADRLFAANLAALRAELGVVTLGTGGGLWQGAGTFASPTTGLRIWNDSGVGRLTTYRSGITQVELDTNGRLSLAAGDIVGDADGFALAASTTQLSQPTPGTPPSVTSIYRSILRWRNGATNATGAIGSTVIDLGLSGIRNRLELQAYSDSSTQTRGEIALTAYGASDRSASVTVSGTFGSGIPSASRVLLTGESIALSGPVSASSTMGVSGAVTFGSTLAVTATATFTGFVNVPYLTITQNGGSGIEIYNRDNSNRWVLYGQGSHVRLYSTLAGTDRWDLDTSGNMNVSGSASFGGHVGVNAAYSGSIGLTSRGPGTGSTTYGLVVLDNLNQNTFYVKDDGSGWLKGSLTQNSDGRGKRNIRALGPALAAILAVAPKRYDRDTITNEAGMIAQELQAILPELVSEDREGALGVNYIGLIPYIIKALQEVYALIPGAPGPKGS